MKKIKLLIVTEVRNLVLNQIVWERHLNASKLYEFEVELVAQNSFDDSKAANADLIYLHYWNFKYASNIKVFDDLVKKGLKVLASETFTTKIRKDVFEYKSMEDLRQTVEEKLNN